jgi:hypothetical protein
MMAGLPGIGLSAMFYAVLLGGMALARVGRWLAGAGRALGVPVGPGRKRELVRARARE